MPMVIEGEYTVEKVVDTPLPGSAKTNAQRLHEALRRQREQHARVMQEQYMSEAQRRAQESMRKTASQLWNDNAMKRQAEMERHQREMNRQAAYDRVKRAFGIK